MKKTALLFVPVLAGCLGSAPKPPVNWTIDIEPDAKVAYAAVCAPSAPHTAASALPYLGQTGQLRSTRAMPLPPPLAPSSRTP